VNEEEREDSLWAPSEDPWYSLQNLVNWQVRMSSCAFCRKGITATRDCSSESMSWRMACDYQLIRLHLRMVWDFQGVNVRRVLGGEKGRG
jgi:hypothetical protein